MAWVFTATKIATPSRLSASGHDIFQAGGFWNGFAIFHKPFDVKGKGLLSHSTSVVQIGAGGDNAGKIRKGHTEVAAGTVTASADCKTTGNGGRPLRGR